MTTKHKTYVTMAEVHTKALLAAGDFSAMRSERDVSAGIAVRHLLTGDTVLAREAAEAWKTYQDGVDALTFRSEARLPCSLLTEKTADDIPTPVSGDAIARDRAWMRAQVAGRAA